MPSVLQTAGFLPASGAQPPSPSDLVVGAVDASAAAFDVAGLFSSRRRLLSLATPWPADTLLVERFQGEDALNTLGHLEIDALSMNAHLPLAELVGEEVCLTLHAHGEPRSWHGLVTQAWQLGADGGLARYRLRLSPWLALLAQRTDCFVFQDRTALQIVEEVFAGYPQARWRVEVTELLRRRSLCTQFNETDWAFVQRLLVEEGLSFHIEHVLPSGDEGDDDGRCHHTVVITDRQAPVASGGTLAFTHAEVRRAGGLGALRGVHALSAERRLQPNAVALAAWDYRRLQGVSAVQSSALTQAQDPDGQPGSEGDAALGPLEHYSGSGAYRYASAAHAERAATLALQAHELACKAVTGASGVPGLRPRERVSIGGHGQLDGNYTLLQVRHEAANNLGAQAARLLQATDLAQGSYFNRFVAVPAAAALVPARAGQVVRKPTAPGGQTAIVVGAQGAPLTTERDLRVKLQFAWQRGEQPLAGGLPHHTAGDCEGNAPADASSGTWVRVAQPWAGSNWGAVHVPRVGAQVWVSYVEGDIDRPVVAGQLYNGADAPPLAAGVDSGVNHPGVVSGVHASTLEQAGGGQWSQWVIDDATGQLRQRLVCSYAVAEVGLGHLIGQGSSAQRGPWLGSGFMLHTAGWASVRAAQGLLVSTTARTGTYGSAQSTQMDAGEAVAQLKGGHELGQRLAEVARAGKAAALDAHLDDPAKGSWARTLRALDPLQDGHFEAPEGGQAAKKEAADRSPGDPVERPAQPLLVLDTPATAAFVTPASTAVFAGQHISAAVQGDCQHSAAHTWAAVSGGTSSVYTHQGGIQATAANANLSLRAHTDALELLADQAVQVISAGSEIRIQASSRIELVGGDSALVLDGDSITFKTPGSFVVKAASHQWLGVGGEGAQLPALPSGSVELKHWVGVQYLDEYSGEPIEGAQYEIHQEGSPVISGTLNSQGQAEHHNVPGKPVKRVVYKPRTPEDDKPHAPLNELIG